MAQEIIDKAKLKRKFEGKNVLVLGIGVLGGGVGMAKFFAKLGANVIATDLKSQAELDQKQLTCLTELGVELILGRHREKDIRSAALIIRNPAVPEDSLFLKLAYRQGIPVTMDEALFARLCPLPIIGITGTRGKTTTTFMTAAVLRQAGFHTVIGGNVNPVRIFSSSQGEKEQKSDNSNGVKGNATLPLLWQLKKNTKTVLELSSWALQGFGWSKISPQSGIITNIYPDHLNRYSSMEEYVKDKEVIFRYQTVGDLLILNRQDPYSDKFARFAPGKVRYFSANDLPASFRLNVPGDHNRANAAAVLTLARSLGIADNLVKTALEKFEGVPYRLQRVRVIREVAFINDTTSTTPAACMAAIKTFSDRNIVLMIGGATKNLPLNELVDTIVRNTVKDFVFLAGEGTRQLQEKLREKDLLKSESIIYSDLTQAVKAAQKKAAHGDVVLFSPAFTSFAMFKNEFDRGEKFNQVVAKL